MTSLYNIVLLQIGIVGAGLKMQRERENLCFSAKVTTYKDVAVLKAW